MAVWFLIHLGSIHVLSKSLGVQYLFCIFFYNRYFFFVQGGPSSECIIVSPHAVRDMSEKDLWVSVGSVYPSGKKLISYWMTGQPNVIISSYPSTGCSSMFRCSIIFFFFFWCVWKNSAKRFLVEFSKVWNWSWLWCDLSWGNKSSSELWRAHRSEH